MNGVLEAAVEVDQRLSESGLPYCLIGGIALQRWGQPRTTLNVDVRVVTEFGNEEPAIQQPLAYSSHGSPTLRNLPAKAVSFWRERATMWELTSRSELCRSSRA